MDSKEVELPSIGVCLGTLYCRCFKETKVCNRDLIIHIRDPLGRDRVCVMISFKHVNYIRVAEHDVKRALVLCVNEYCQGKIHGMFAGETSKIIGDHFDIRSQHWDKRFVMIDFTKCDSERSELLRQILTLAAERRMSLANGKADAYALPFISHIPDCRYSTLLTYMSVKPAVVSNSSKQMKDMPPGVQKSESCLATPVVSADSMTADMQPGKPNAVSCCVAGVSPSGPADAVLSNKPSEVSTASVSLLPSSSSSETGTCNRSEASASTHCSVVAVNIDTPSNKIISSVLPSGEHNLPAGPGRASLLPCTLSIAAPIVLASTSTAEVANATLKRSHEPDVELGLKRAKQNGSSQLLPPPLIMSRLGSAPTIAQKRTDTGVSPRKATDSLRPQILPRIQPSQQSTDAIHVVHVPIAQISSPQQKGYRQVLPKPAFTSGAASSLAPRPVMKTLAVVSAPTSPLVRPQMAKSFLAINTATTPVPSRMATTASSPAFSKTAGVTCSLDGKTPSKPVIVVCRSSASSAQQNSGATANANGLPKKVASPSLRDSAAKRVKDELTKEREQLRTTRNVVMLNYPEGEPEAIEVFVKDIDTLQPGELLNDNIIVFYLNYIRNKFVSPERRDSLFFFDTYFYWALTKGIRNAKDRYKQLYDNYGKVQRRTRKVDLFSKDYIVVPICEAQHWYAAVITFPRAAIVRKRSAGAETKGDDEMFSQPRIPALPVGVRKAHIVILDSFIDYNETKCYLVMGSLLKYLEHEYNARRRKDALDDEYFDRQRFDMLCPKKIPQQKNVYDCGIYMLKFLEYFLVNPPVLLGRSDVFPRWYPRFDAGNARENILSKLKKLCGEEKWKKYLEYRKKDDYFTDLIGDRAEFCPSAPPEPIPLRRMVSESDLCMGVEILPNRRKQKRRGSSSA